MGARAFSFAVHCERYQSLELRRVVPTNKRQVSKRISDDESKHGGRELQSAKAISDAGRGAHLYNCSALLEFESRMPYPVIATDDSS